MIHVKWDVRALGDRIASSLTDWPTKSRVKQFHTSSVAKSTYFLPLKGKEERLDDSIVDSTD